MTDKILMYEELSLNAHPAIQTQHYDGWVLRFADGYTKRANSISPLHASTLDLKEKIAECEIRYFSQGLPTVFKLTDTSHPNMEKILSERGYALADPTYVMEMDLHGKEFPQGDFVMTDYADEAWLNTLFAFDSRIVRDGKEAVAKQIIENVKCDMICGRIIKNGVDVACGSAVIERGYMGLLNVVVDKEHRGKGCGREICESLLSAAKNIGAHTAYLQVIQENQVAVNMYKKLGYKHLYTQRYWVKKKEA